jgi:inosose dehydratase
LQAAGKAAQALAPDSPRIVETVLGGKPEQWSEVKDLMAARLRDWAKVAIEGEFIVAIKAHVGGALHTPADAVWLMERAESPNVRCVFDDSHFQLRGFDTVESARTLAPHAVFVHVKDARGDAVRPQFLLPGDGSTDYVQLLKSLAAARYRGDIVVEVSAQIHARPDYDPLPAAKRCYEYLAPAFQTAGIRRA